MNLIEFLNEALNLAERALDPFTPGQIEAVRKSGGDPVTEADLAVNEALAAFLPAGEDGWLSEETADDPKRLDAHRVWVVDPVDGTKEFVMGIPEWCVSIGLVEGGEAVAGAISNPAAGHRIVGTLGDGVFLNGVAAGGPTGDGRPVVLASRSEVDRGEWNRFEDGPFAIRPMGSVAYKLGRVAAGLDPVTWTLVPKHEWDIAAGVALVHAAGGTAFLPDGRPPRFNQPTPRVDGLVAAAPELADTVRHYLGIS